MASQTFNFKPSELTEAFDADDVRGRAPPIVTASQLAALLQVPEKTLYSWIGRGRLNGCW